MEIGIVSWCQGNGKDLLIRQQWFPQFRIAYALHGSASFHRHHDSCSGRLRGYHEIELDAIGSA